MSRFTLPNGSTVQADTPTTIGSVLYPQGVRVLSGDEKNRLGVVEVVEEPMPDVRYGFATEDPRKPGTWLFTPLDGEVLKLRLIEHAAARRFTQETGGVWLPNGTFFYTDRESQSQLAGAYALVSAVPEMVIQWKSWNEKDEVLFVALDAPGLLEVGKFVGGFVQQCFETEKQVLADIKNGKITTFEEIDQLFPINDPRIRPST